VDRLRGPPMRRPTASMAFPCVAGKKTEMPSRSERCCLLEGQVRRLGREHVFWGRCVLGEGAVTRAEDFVARLKARDVLADRHDRARDMRAPYTRPESAESEADNAHQLGFAGHQMPITDVDASRVNAARLVPRHSNTTTR